MRYCALALVLALLSTAGHARAPVFGWVEHATIEPWGVQVKAKLDTGALTSSMHAEDIRLFERENQEWVSFRARLLDQRSGEQVEKEFELPLYRDVQVRGAGGSDSRPVVLMKLCVGDTVYEEQFSLRDRSNMIYPVLLGRRALQHMGPIDVTQTFVHALGCDADSPVKAYVSTQDDADIDAEPDDENGTDR